MTQDKGQEAIRRTITLCLILLFPCCSRVSDPQSVQEEFVASDPSERETEDVAANVAAQPDIILPIGRRIQRIVVEYDHFGSSELPETRQFVVRPSDHDALIQALGFPRFQSADRQRRFLGEEVANIKIIYDGPRQAMMRVLVTFTTGPVLFYSIDGVRYRSDWSKQSPIRDSIMFTAFLEDLEKQSKN